MPAGLIPVLSLANFVIGMGAFLVVGALTPIARGLSMSAAEAGSVLTVYALSYAVLSPVLVALTGRIGRRRVMTAGMVLFAAGATASALAPSEGWLLAARVLAASGAGMTTPVAAAVAVALAPPEARGRVLARVFLGLTLAQVAGVPFGSWVAYAHGWRAAFVLVAGLAALAAVAIWIRVPAGLSFQPVRLADLAAVLRAPRLMLAILFTASFLGAIYVPFTYVAPLLETTLGLGRDGVTLALVIAGAGAVVGNLAGGRMSDRLGPYRSLLILACLQVGLMPLLSLLPVPLAAAFALIFVWMAAGYAFNAGQQVRLVALAGARAPVALSLHAASIYLGAAIGAAAGGVVVARYGVGAAGLAGGIAALGAVVHIVMSRQPVDTDRADA
ncbi:MFS transporter [Jannaschia sp. S6380]|uniref:MFS transporter n=1 Tax=Jannaschia sp. S6380 TaxID=2926408 RepID=UPI001FF3DBC7|nr:MFS transporter [Jannaschia sp. S6380]MCK0169189.1 MFS transporter [Jannaschia sp. S6380]